MSDQELAGGPRQQLRRHRRPLLLATGLGLAVSVTQLVQPRVIGDLISGVEERTSLTTPVVQFAICISVLATLSCLQQLVLARTSEEILFGIRRNLVRSAFRAPVRKLEREGGARTTAQIVNDPPIVQGAITSAFVTGGSSALTLVGGTIAAVLIDPRAFGIAILVALLSIVIAVVAGRPVRRIRQKIQTLLADFAENQHDTFDAYAVVVAFGARASSERRAVDELSHLRTAGIRMARLHAVVGPLSDLMLNIAFVAALVVSGVRTANGDQSFADFVMFIMYFQLATAPISSLAYLWVQIKEGQASNDRIDERLRALAPEDSSALHQKTDTFETTLRRPVDHALRFSSVTFEYDGDPILKGLDLTVPRGSSLAIVGASGAGKSTALSLAAGFSAPTSGLVDWASGPQRSGEWSRVGYVDQKASVLKGTVRTNLLLGRPGIGDDELLRTLRAVGLGSFATLDGLDAPLSGRGSNLSGGERQKVAVARALVGGPDLLLLDEPTAHLDGASEHQVVDLILRSRRGASVVLVTHRAATAAVCDEVLLLEGGTISQRGSHEALSSSSPRYRELLGVPTPQTIVRPRGDA